MALVLALAIGLVTVAGIYLILGRRSFEIILGLGLLSYAVNLFIFVMGRWLPEAPPILGLQPPPWTDPLPQALVLTAIVIGFAMQALVVVLAMALFGREADDHVNDAPDS